MSGKRMSIKQFLTAASICSSVILSGCATESHRVITPQKVESANTQYLGVKTALVVGNFQNRSNYMQGLFSSNVNQLGNQAKTILKTPTEGK